jgi:hypothetical protein
MSVTILRFINPIFHKISNKIPLNKKCAPSSAFMDKFNCECSFYRDPSIGVNNKTVADFRPCGTVL